MKTKKIILGSVLFASVFFSCVDKEIPLEDIKASPSFEAGSLNVEKDSLRIQNELQSDSELMILDRIIYKNSVYILDLSAEEAADLDIPNEIYEKYKGYVNALNDNVR